MTVIQTGRQDVHLDNPALFVPLRSSPDGQEQILCIQNISNHDQSYSLSAAPSTRLIDLVSGNSYNAEGGLDLTLRPYQTLWLAPLA